MKFIGIGVRSGNEFNNCLNKAFPVDVNIDFCSKENAISQNLTTPRVLIELEEIEEIE